MPADLLDLAGRVALVTGGGTGIGAACVRRLAEHGASVVLAGRTLDRLESVARSVEAETGSRCLAVRADVREEDEVVALVDQVMTAFGAMDILVNNAGGARLVPLNATTTRLWNNKSRSLQGRSPPADISPSPPRRARCRCGVGSQP